MEEVVELQEHLESLDVMEQDRCGGFSCGFVRAGCQ